MTTNRVLAFLRPRAACECCSRRRQVEQRLEAVQAIAERIEYVAGPDVFEFWVPSVDRVLNPKPDDEGEAKISIALSMDSQEASIDDDLVQFAISELRRIGEALFTAAARIAAAEGGAP